MEIVTVNDRCFLVLRHVNTEKFSCQENFDAYFKDKIWLRKPDSPEVLIVREIFDGLIEEPIITSASGSEPEILRESSPPKESTIDIKI